MIGILKKNFQEENVDEHVLDSMLMSNRLIAFSRREGWVVVGRDAIRKHHIFYTGKERRRVTSGNDFSMK